LRIVLQIVENEAKCTTKNVTKTPKSVDKHPVENGKLRYSAFIHEVGYPRLFTASCLTHSHCTANMTNKTSLDSGSTFLMFWRNES